MEEDESFLLNTSKINLKQHQSRSSVKKRSSLFRDTDKVNLKSLPGRQNFRNIFNEQKTGLLNDSYISQESKPRESVNCQISALKSLRL